MRTACLTLLLALGCSSSPDPTPPADSGTDASRDSALDTGAPPPRCEPGRVLACGAGTGCVQTCDGAGVWGPCSCPDAGGDTGAALDTAPADTGVALDTGAPADTGSADAALACPTGRGDCDGVASNGCETDLAVGRRQGGTTLHCGRCDLACANPLVCDQGRCAQ